MNICTVCHQPIVWSETFKHYVDAQNNSLVCLTTDQFVSVHQGPKREGPYDDAELTGTEGS